MKLIYFGSGAFGQPTIEALASQHEILAIVTQPDRPAGRRRKLTPTPIAQWASTHLASVPVLKPQNVNAQEVTEQLRALPTDAFVIIAFGQKLSPALLCERFSINLHGSRLPRWRGAAPINSAILAGDTHTGCSVISLAEKMDAGLIFAQSSMPIEPSQTAGDLHDALASHGPSLVLDVLSQHQTGSFKPTSQVESEVTLAPKLTRDDANVEFTATAEHCRRRINGLSPWPGVSVSFNGQPLKLIRATIGQSQQGLAQQDHGRLCDPIQGLVACGSGTVLKLLEVQPPGKKPMPWSDFARGRPVQEGQMFESLESC